MNQSTIMIVDDEERIRKVLFDYFTKLDYQVKLAKNGEEAIDIFYANKVDLVILDIMMPVMDGYETLKELRKISNVPVMILSAKSEEYDILKGFELYADEYVAKPFNLKILSARVEALLRRTSGLSEEVTIGDLTYNKATYEVSVKGEKVELTNKEFELLGYLILNKGIVLSRDDILNNVWHYDYFGDVRTVDVTIRRLREKIEDDPAHPLIIMTKRGIGYYLNK